MEQWTVQFHYSSCPFFNVKALSDTMIYLKDPDCEFAESYHLSHQSSLVCSLWHDWDFYCPATALFPAARASLGSIPGVDMRRAYEQKLKRAQMMWNDDGWWWMTYVCDGDIWSLWLSWLFFFRFLVLTWFQETFNWSSGKRRWNWQRAATHDRHGVAVTKRWMVPVTVSVGGNTPSVLWRSWSQSLASNWNSPQRDRSTPAATGKWTGVIQRCGRNPSAPPLTAASLPWSVASSCIPWSPVILISNTEDALTKSLLDSWHVISMNGKDIGDMYEIPQVLKSNWDPESPSWSAPIRETASAKLWRLSGSKPCDPGDNLARLFSKMLTDIASLRVTLSWKPLEAGSKGMESVNQPTCCAGSTSKSGPSKACRIEGNKGKSATLSCPHDQTMLATCLASSAEIFSREHARMISMMHGSACSTDASVQARLARSMGVATLSNNCFRDFSEIYAKTASSL